MLTVAHGEILINCISGIYVIIYCYNLPIFKKNVLKHWGTIDKAKQVQDVLTNSMSITMAIWIIGGLMAIICISFIILLHILLHIIFSFSVPFIIYIFDHPSYLVMHAIVLIGGVYWLNHILLYKKNKYLSWFKQFEKISLHQKRKGKALTIFTILGIFAFFIGSFWIYMTVVNGGSVP